MGRPRKFETVLMDALESGDNLAILKAQRMLIGRDLQIADLDVKDKVQLINSLTRINSDIIKLEGTQEIYEGDELTSFEEDDRIRELLSFVNPSPSDEEDGEEDAAESEVADRE